MKKKLSIIFILASICLSSFFNILVADELEYEDEKKVFFSECLFYDPLFDFYDICFGYDYNSVLDIMQEDQDFYRYVYTSNDIIGKKITALLSEPYEFGGQNFDCINVYFADDKCYKIEFLSLLQEDKSEFNNAKISADIMNQIFEEYDLKQIAVDTEFDFPETDFLFRDKNGTSFGPMYSKGGPLRLIMWKPEILMEYLLR